MGRFVSLLSIPLYRAIVMRNTMRTHHRREIELLEFPLVKPRRCQIRCCVLRVLRQHVLAFFAQPGQYLQLTGTYVSKRSLKGTIHDSELGLNGPDMALTRPFDGLALAFNYVNVNLTWFELVRVEWFVIKLCRHFLKRYASVAMQREFTATKDQYKFWQ